VNALADASPDTVRISMDTKAVVHVGQYSRGGKSRGVKRVEALDHDMRPKEKLVPGGILEVESGSTFLFFSSGGNSSDFCEFTILSQSPIGSIANRSIDHRCCLLLCLHRMRELAIDDSFVDFNNRFILFRDIFFSCQ